MSYKQNMFLSPDEKAIISTLMPGNFSANMLELMAKAEESSWIVKNFASVSNTYIQYDTANTVEVKGWLFAYDQRYIGNLMAQISAGVATENLGLVDEPAAMLMDVNTPIVVDIEVAGLGGLDTGTEQVSTWYYVYIIGKSTAPSTVSAVLSEESDLLAVTLPTGYDLCAFVGMVYNGPGGDFVEFEEVQCGETREYWFYTKPPVLTAGTAGSWTEISPSFLPDVNVCGSFLNTTVNTAGVYSVGAQNAFASLTLDMVGTISNQYVPNIGQDNEFWYITTTPGGSLTITLAGFKYKTGF